MVAALAKRRRCRSGVEDEVAVLRQGGVQVEQDRLEALATDPVCGLPEVDAGITDCPIVSPLSDRGGGGRGWAGNPEQANCALAMADGHGGELVQDICLLRLSSTDAVFCGSGQQRNGGNPGK
jgi:hypothetical protein